jgi:hypothetical protein
MTEPSAQDNPTWESKVQYQQGSVGGRVYIFLRCVNVPAGSAVAFHAVKEGPIPPIVLPETTVPKVERDFVVGCLSLIPAEYRSDIVFRWFSRGFPPQPNMSITLEALIAVDPGVAAAERAADGAMRPMPAIVFAGITVSAPG